MITPLGSLTVGAAVPGVALSIAQLATLIAAELSAKLELQAQLDGNVSFDVPDPAALATAVAESVLGFDPAAMISASAGFSADLTADIAAKAAIVAPAQTLVATLQGAVASAGLTGYTHSGRADTLGSELAAAVASDFASSAAVHAVVLVAATPEAFAALSAILKTS